MCKRLLLLFEFFSAKWGATAVRDLTGTKRREHIPSVLPSLPLPPVHTRIDFKLLLLVYKALNALDPQYMLDPLKSEELPGPLRSSGTGHLDVPRSVHRVVDLRFIFYAPAWIDLLRICFAEAPYFCLKAFSVAWLLHLSHWIDYVCGFIFVW